MKDNIKNNFLVINQSRFLDGLYERKIEILELILSHFLDLKIFPVIGLEIEFYLIKNNQPLAKDEFIINNFISDFTTKLNQYQTLAFKIEKEQGASQLEVKTSPSSQIQEVCENLLLIKKTSKELAENSGLSADFRAQPFINDCGSALQINISFIDKEGNNLFVKKDKEESTLLLNSVGGILQMTDQLMGFCVPNPEDYYRHNLELNFNLFKNKKYTAPINISWGYDNRTTLIRIPRSSKKEERRLEFRLPSADADIYLVIVSLLLAINYGIDNKINPPKAIYGNAFDGNYFNDSYNLEPLINSKILAQEKFFTPNPILNNLKKLIT